MLAVLDLPIEIEEPVPGVDLPAGALSVVADGVEYSYREGGPVLHGITLDVPPGSTWRSSARPGAARPRS